MKNTSDQSQATGNGEQVPSPWSWHPEHSYKGGYLWITIVVISLVSSAISLDLGWTPFRGQLIATNDLMDNLAAYLNLSSG